MDVLRPEKKQEVYDVLADALITAMETGEYTMEDVHDTSDFVLTRMESISDVPTLLSFLKELSDKWPFYMEAYTKYSSEFGQAEDTADTEKIKEELSQL